ncbi:hypothetical protein CVT24_005007 [Panaeolus cyanescens]|uniref:Sterol 3-beta-glucosyltransferase n=1 Tax=Panaeolus cyanescens TaxID=181874 RepID=A0A409YB94_9AGAR|nr:hypothetical protein CVT24_005007 [Panaeolus cyanescens]
MAMWQSFQGDGTMRAGTQTLIQALQALPWGNEEDEDNPNDPGSPGSESDDEKPNSEHPLLKLMLHSLHDLVVQRLSSSIHAIHRPLARSHRTASSFTNAPQFHQIEDIQEDVLSSEEEHENDFEETPRLSTVLPTSLKPNDNDVPLNPPDAPFNAMAERSSSTATIRLNRRARLAEKLKEVYDLDEIEEVWAEMPCWLLRSVLLQGYMYLTNSHLCFFAHMPSREDQVLKSGSLNKKAQRTKRWIKHWFVLKNDALSWYQSSSDPYFPHGIVDLRYAMSCDSHGEKGFRIRTNAKTVHLSADSIPSRDEWVKAICKVIFKAQNMGDSVKIAVPYSAILDVERSSAMDFSETIEVKVVDKDDQLTVDSYFFAYFHNLQGALDQIRNAIRNFRGSAPADISLPQIVLDTTASKPPMGLDRPSATESPISPKSTGSGFRLASIFRPFSDTVVPNRPPTSTPISDDEFTHVIHQTDSKSFVPVVESPSSATPQAEYPTSGSKLDSQSLPPEHTYPPSPSNSSTNPDSFYFYRDNSSASSWGVGVPSWLKSKRVFSALTTDSATSIQSQPVKEVYSSNSTFSQTGRSGQMDMAFSILETPDMLPDQETAEKFRTSFAYDEKEKLLGYFPGYIYRLLPVFGKLYISTNYFCFKSSGPLAARTRMTLPIRDILALEKSKANKFGHHGLIIIVKGHEELFFEFAAEEKRNAFVLLLERQMEDLRLRSASGDSPAPSSSQRDALILEEFDTRTSGSNESDPAPPPDNMADSLPAVMFTSASSTFLTFKPKSSLHFTFLTIGSRGDVQPYIALAKGLMAEGHRCRIATHGEFKEWIESHGIEFGYVGGDPAELMRICVENGTFTVSFLKEGLLKFRGWVDDLLKTSWEACQGTDVLMESPSAMGGYHIAEALGIPYFRAFTMTWTRTRAYPHAFAVPERKMGGGYNYMSYVMFDQVFWRATAGQINRWRKHVLHLPPTSLDRMETHRIPFLYNFSPQIVPPPLDWPEWIRVTGYWFLDDADVSAKKWTPPPSLVEFIDKAHSKGHKVVYIGFGSIVVSDPKSMTRIVVEAVLRSGVYAILSKGWSDRLQAKSGDPTEIEEPLPKQIYPISSVPHDWLFQRIDAACHHGGAGTTGASLRAGIPTIIRPFFGDQFFWADRVEALGVGSGVRKLTTATLSEALTTATTDYKQIGRAKAMGEQIRAEDGVATAIETIYRDLDYARSLVKHHPPEDADEGANEESTIRNNEDGSPSSCSSSAASARGAHSDDWSVISDQEDADNRRSSFGSRRSSRHSESRSAGKRTSFTAAVLSVLPDKFLTGSLGTSAT